MLLASSSSFAELLQPPVYYYLPAQLRGQVEPIPFTDSTAAFNSIIGSTIANHVSSTEAVSCAAAGGGPDPESAFVNFIPGDSGISSFIGATLVYNCVDSINIVISTLKFDNLVLGDCSNTSYLYNPDTRRCENPSCLTSITNRSGPYDPFSSDFNVEDFPDPLSLYCVDGCEYTAEENIIFLETQGLNGESCTQLNCWHDYHFDLTHTHRACSSPVPVNFPSPDDICDLFPSDSSCDTGGGDTGGGDTGGGGSGGGDTGGGDTGGGDTGGGDTGGGDTGGGDTGQSIDDYCQQNPNSQLCIESSYTGSGCDSLPSCNGDAVQCAIVLEQHRIKCALEVPDGLTIDEVDIGVQAGNDTGETIDTVFNVSDSDFIDISDPLGGYTPNVTSDCPQPYSFSFRGSSIVMPLDAICDFAGLVRPLVLLLAFITAAFIYYRGLIREV